MGDIKLRAWINEEMVNVKSIDFDDVGNLYHINGKLVNPLKVKLMQYTGLKDKNGKEIYEGDILQDRSGLLYLVKYNEHYAGFYIHDVFEGEVRDGISSFNEYIIKSHVLKVIDNIYENKKMEVK